MVTEPPTPNEGPEPPGEKLARRIAHHVNEARVASATSETQRRLEASAALARHFNEELKPALKPIVAEVLAKLPEDHPLYQLTALLNSPLPSVFNDLLNAFLDLIGIPFALTGVMTGAGRILAEQFLNEFQADHTDIAIPVPDIADMMERNIFDANGNATASSGAVINAYAEAAKSGIDSDRLDLITLDTGEPYGIMEALALLRRGAITIDQFTTVLYYSRVRNEFLDQVLELQYSYMSPADVVEMALKGIAPDGIAFGTPPPANATAPGGPWDADYQAMFQKAGGLVENWYQLLEAAGNPIGVINAVNQYYHQVPGVTLDTVNQVIAHSRINPMFTSLVLNEHYKWLTATQIHQALKAGTVDSTTALGWLIENGYDATQAAAFAGAASAEAVAGSKALAESLIADAYKDAVLGSDAALAALEQIGYSAASAGIILSTIDAEKSIGIQKVAVNRIRTLMVAGRINAQQATTDLTNLGLPPAAVTQYVGTWTIEAQSTVKTLTEAQVGRLYAKGAISSATAIARWVAMGYSTTDAADLVNIYETTKSQE